MEIEEIVPHYHSNNFFVRTLFLKRLNLAIKIAEKKLNLPAKIKVIDLGCGEGKLLKRLEEYSDKLKLFGVDIEPKVIKIKEFLQRSEIKIADLRQSGYPDEFFDVVFCLDVLEHFASLKEPVNEIKRILKSDGLLVVSLPTENFLFKLGRFMITGTPSMEKGPTTPHFHIARTVEKFLAMNGFSIVEKKYLPALPLLSLFHIIAFEKTSRL